MARGLARAARRLALAAAAVLSAIAPAAAGVADQVGATFGLLIQDVVGAFPAIEGFVASLDGDRIYLDLTEKAGARVGQEFTVFRKGEVFRHPVTGKALGRYE